jgi:SAM-dependent methyltransferase
MRDCPVCKEPDAINKVEFYNATSVINSGGEAPSLSLLECEECHFHYVDGLEVDQSWFDHYYTTYYKTDDAPFSDARLSSLAACVRAHGIHTVLDIGGMDFELMKRLIRNGVMGLAAGVYDIPVEGFEAVILSHTLEHIYDVPAMFERIKAALVPGGLLFVEVPIWLNYDDLTYDNHWQHVNKLRPSDLKSIFKANGFDVILSTRIEDYREYKVWRIIGRLI